MELLDKACKNKNFAEMLSVCKDHSFKHFGLFICDIIQNHRRTDIKDDLAFYIQYFQNIKNVIKVQLLCNWTSSEALGTLWSKMATNDEIIFTNDHPDYYVIINQPPPNAIYKKEKTIVFHMEPFQDTFPSDPEQYLKVFRHETSVNNLEWHLSWSFQDFMEIPIDKFFDTEISAVLSEKYQNVGQQLRIDFVKFLEKDVDIHVFGSNAYQYRDYRGPLPYHEKDFGLFPYKYHIAVENNSIHNYVTEKLIDGILSECVVFYWGCPNISDIIDSRAFILLPLDDFEKSKQIIQQALQENEWEKRIEYIRNEKKRIINELTFYPRLLKTIHDIRT